MKWLHFSDLHISTANDGTDTICLRDNMITYLKDNKILVDKVIFSGDLRNANIHTDSDKNAQKSADYIINIARAVGVTDNDNILIVAGNHDLEREFENRQQCLIECKKKYTTTDGKLKNIETLTNSFTFYFRVLKYIYGKDYAESYKSNMTINPHVFQSYSECNFLLLNTELLVGQIVTDINGKPATAENNLYIGSSYVAYLLSQKNNNRTTIAIGHRGLDLLDLSEIRKLTSLFKKYNVSLFLCGHNHELWYSPLNIPQVTMGCIKQENGVKAGFSIGIIDTKKNLISIKAYSWDNNCWSEYSHFYESKSILEIDFNNNVSENNEKYDNVIKIVIKGIPREFKCEVIDMQHGVDNSSQMMTLVTGTLLISVLNTKYSSDIKVSDKFILSQNVWNIYGIDDTKKGCTTFTCKKELKGNSDDFIKMIASTNLIVNYTIKLLSSIIHIGIGQLLHLTPLLYANGIALITEPLTLSSSDDSIISIRNDNNIFGESIGEAYVLITWDYNNDIFLKVNISVENKVEDTITYCLCKLDKMNNKKYDTTFTVHKIGKILFGIDKFVNGLSVDNDTSFDFEIMSCTDNINLLFDKITDNIIEINTENAIVNTTYAIKAKCYKNTEECVGSLFVKSFI